MLLLRDYLTREFNKLIETGVKLKVIGDMGPSSPVPEEIRKLLEKAVQDSVQNTKLTLGLCFNYGGRNEITRAMQKLVGQGVQPDEITEEKISAALDTAEFPDPDLVIRTSGEQRLSNFMPWQTAYAELYFDPTFWPDFDAVALDRAIAAYSNRERRFGAVPVAPKKQAEG
jgi:undecaprenyl diphosphate synthase